MARKIKPGTKRTIDALRNQDIFTRQLHDVRPHQSLDYQTPREVFEGEACEYVDKISASLRDAPALPTYSQAHRQ
jgi:hypothetical protein